MIGDNPRIVSAIVGALRFHGSLPEKLSSLSDSEWHELLDYADLSHLTLSLGARCSAYLPEWVRDRVSYNQHDNRVRAGLIQESYREILTAFTTANVQHVVIKGFAQCPDYAPNPQNRFQSDIDLYCPEHELKRATNVLRQLEYRSIPTPTFADHLPVMIRPRGWKWRGNSFDPEMPPSLELHHRLWNYRALRFGPTDLGDFWLRRTMRTTNGLTYPALHPVDNLGFSALQVLRDLLQFRLAAHKVYELAYFLNRKTKDRIFWRDWKRTHNEELRYWEAVSFCLADACFGCDLAPELSDEIAMLPGMIRAWMAKYAQSSLTTYRSSEKNAVWVHAALVSSAQDKLAVLMKMFPPAPDQEKAIGSIASSSGKPFRTKRFGKYAIYCLQRIPRHTVIIPRTMYRGVRSLLASRHFPRPALKRSNAAFDFSRSA